MEQTNLAVPTPSVPETTGDQATHAAQAADTVKPVLTLGTMAATTPASLLAETDVLASSLLGYALGLAPDGLTLITTPHVVNHDDMAKTMPEFHELEHSEFRLPAYDSVDVDARGSSFPLDYEAIRCSGIIPHILPIGDSFPRSPLITDSHIPVMSRLGDGPAPTVVSRECYEVSAGLVSSVVSLVSKLLVICRKPKVVDQPLVPGGVEVKVPEGLKRYNYLYYGRTNAAHYAGHGTHGTVFSEKMFEYHADKVSFRRIAAALSMYAINTLMKSSELTAVVTLLLERIPEAKVMPLAVPWKHRIEDFPFARQRYFQELLLRTPLLTKRVLDPIYSLLSLPWTLVSAAQVSAGIAAVDTSSRNRNDPSSAAIATMTAYDPLPDYVTVLMSSFYPIKISLGAASFTGPAQRANLISLMLFAYWCPPTAPFTIELVVFIIKVLLEISDQNVGRGAWANRHPGGNFGSIGYRGARGPGNNAQANANANANPNQMRGPIQIGSGQFVGPTDFQHLEELPTEILNAASGWFAIPAGPLDVSHLAHCLLLGPFAAPTVTVPYYPPQRLAVPWQYVHYARGGSAMLADPVVAIARWRVIFTYFAPLMMPSIDRTSVVGSWLASLTTPVSLRPSTMDTITAIHDLLHGLPASLPMLRINAATNLVLPTYAGDEPYGQPAVNQRRVSVFHAQGAWRYNRVVVNCDLAGTFAHLAWNGSPLPSTTAVGAPVADASFYPPAFSGNVPVSAAAPSLRPLLVIPLQRVVQFMAGIAIHERLRGTRSNLITSAAASLALAQRSMILDMSKALTTFWSAMSSLQDLGGRPQRRHEEVLLSAAMSPYPAFKGLEEVPSRPSLHYGMVEVGEHPMVDAAASAAYAAIEYVVREVDFPIRLVGAGVMPRAAPNRVGERINNVGSFACAPSGLVAVVGLVDLEVSPGVYDATRIVANCVVSYYQWCRLDVTVRQAKVLTLGFYLAGEAIVTPRLVERHSIVVPDATRFLYAEPNAAMRFDEYYVMPTGVVLQHYASFPAHTIDPVAGTTSDAYATRWKPEISSVPPVFRLMEAKLGGEAVVGATARELNLPYY